LGKSDRETVKLKQIEGPMAFDFAKIRRLRMDFPLEKIGKYTMLKLSGKISSDRMRSSALYKYLVKLVADGTIFIALNMEELEMLDSSAIGAIIYTYKKIQNQNGSIVIVGGNNIINGILEINNICEIIKKFMTLEEFKAFNKI